MRFRSLSQSGRLWVCLLAMCGSHLAGVAEEPAATRQPFPNILFLMTDDQRWDTLGCMGNAVVQTPHIDRLAAQGTLFSNAWNSQKITRRSPGGPACAMQGRSLVPLLEGRSKSWREDFYHEFTWTADGRIAPSEGIRSARWKCNRYFSQSPVVEQLFDLQADTGESVDLSAVPDHAARLDEMRTKVETYRTALSRP